MSAGKGFPARRAWLGFLFRLYKGATFQPVARRHLVCLCRGEVAHQQYRHTSLPGSGCSSGRGGLQPHVKVLGATWALAPEENFAAQSFASNKCADFCASQAVELRLACGSSEKAIRRKRSCEPGFKMPGPTVVLQFSTASGSSRPSAPRHSSPPPARWPPPDRLTKPAAKPVSSCLTFPPYVFSGASTATSFFSGAFSSVFSVFSLASRFTPASKTCPCTAPCATSPSSSTKPAKPTSSRKVSS